MYKRLFLLVVCAILLFGGIRLAFSANPIKANSDRLYKQVEIFAEAMAIIQREHVNETKTQDLIYGSLKGMLASLDAHSQFMDPETYEELKVDTQGKFGGLGVEITLKDGLLTVITPIEDTPAWKAGIKANDQIVKINDELTREMSLTDAVKKMRGKPGEAVNLTILRDKEKKLLELKIIRDIIKITDIKYVRILEDGIGYVRITEFRENTFNDLNNALNSLAKQGMNKLIIDLRNNPGGVLDVAVKVTAKFLEPDKLIAYTKGRQKDHDLEFYSGPQEGTLRLPLAILINEGSASGSEIVAGALQDYKRAFVVGKKSFGKGSVQTVIPLGDGSAMRLTTAHYFTPSGKIIQGQGITPDILVEMKEKKPAKADPGLEEEPAPEPAGFDYKKDAQILRAMEALKNR